MPSLGPAEILVVLVIALLVFGPDKMPDIARQVGRGFREFKRVQQHLKSELRDVVSEFDQPTGTPTPAPTGDPVPMLPPRDDARPPASTIDAATIDATDAAAPASAAAPPSEVALPSPTETATRPAPAEPPAEST